MQEQPQTVQGRLVTATDLALIRGLIGDHPDWNRTRISRELCRLWQWADEVGRSKDMACRTLLLKLERRDLIRLPCRQGPSVNHRRGRTFYPALHETTPIHGVLQDLAPVCLIPADSGPERQLWQTFLSVYHYLGFTTKVGKTLSYLALSRDQRPLACLLFGAAAWKTAPRDRFIGWTTAQRQRNLQKVVNNMRFLILPWVTVPHLASHLLGQALRRLPADWQSKYGCPVCLAETFVDRSRFRGTCYKAANWIYVGDTRGRTRNDVHHRLEAPVKAVYVRPLCSDFRTQLTGG